MKTKFFSFFIVLLAASAGSAQIYNNYAMQMALFNQPNARSEALGWGNAVLTGSPFMSIYNPAASSFSKGITAEISHLDVNFPANIGAGYAAYGASANLGRYGSVSLNYLRFSWDNEFYITTAENPAPVNKYKPVTSIFILNYSYMIMNSLSAGININYFNDVFPTGNLTGYMVDAGFLNKFILKDGAAPVNLYLGLSASNITNSKLELKSEYDDHYPSILRLAAGLEYEHETAVSGLRIFRSLLMSEYYDMLNSGFYSRKQFGLEISLLEMIKLRGGWFTEDRSTYGVKENFSTLEKFTYGFGVELPFSRFMGKTLPLNINVDYASLKFPKYSTWAIETENCPVYTVCAAYEL